MTEYGGLGGIKGGRAINLADRFETDVAALLGGKMMESSDLCRRLWGSLANCDWTNADGDTASYSFRAAGDLIAAVLARGDYMDWYCSAPAGRPDPEIAEAMAGRGWTVEAIE